MKKINPKGKSQRFQQRIQTHKVWLKNIISPLSFSLLQEILMGKSKLESFSYMHQLNDFQVIITRDGRDHSL